MENATVRANEELESAIRDALSSVRLADGMISMNLVAGVDASGDPAVHITVTLRAGKFTDAELLAINATLYEIRRRVLDLDLGSFPYFRLEQAA